MKKIFCESCRLKTLINRKLMTGILAVFTGCSFASATSFIELESSYLGDGWFQYRMKLDADAFIDSAAVTGIGLYFTNFLEYGTSPVQWSNLAPTNAFVGWDYDLINTNVWLWQDRPYERTFLVRSTEKTYRQSSTNSVLTFVFVPHGFTDGHPCCVSGNFAGYVTAPCLIPCAPGEADGSPPDFLYVFKMIPDIELGGLIQTNGVPYGVTVRWIQSCTVELQGSFDLIQWSPVARFDAGAGETIWTTNSPLNSFGRSFRVQLINAPGIFNNIVSRPNVTVFKVP